MGLGASGVAGTPPHGMHGTLQQTWDALESVIAALKAAAMCGEIAAGYQLLVPNARANLLRLGCVTWCLLSAGARTAAAADLSAVDSQLALQTCSKWLAALAVSPSAEQ